MSVYCEFCDTSHADGFRCVRVTADAPRPRGKRVKPWRLEVREMIRDELHAFACGDSHWPNATPTEALLAQIEGALLDHESRLHQRSWFRRLLDRLEAAVL